MTTFADITTFKVGGPIARLVRAETREQFVATLTELVEKGESHLIVGGGSNLLASDEGYAGTVVMPTFADVRYEGEVVIAEAGASWDALVADAGARGLWGIENLSGIPGTVGGAVVANIGAYGAALSESVVSVEVFDTERQEMHTLTVAECAYGYRTSIFKHGHYAVLSVRLQLSQVPNPNLTYKDLAAAFPTGDAALADIRNAVLAIRAKKFPSLTEYGTAGSFFLNPVVTETEAAAAQARFPGMPVFPLPEGGVKIPIAWIFEHAAGIAGMREGGASVWPAHALVIATDKGATAHDVRALAAKISARVQEVTGIAITPEVFIV